MTGTLEEPLDEDWQAKLKQLFPSLTDNYKLVHMDQMGASPAFTGKKALLIIGGEAGLYGRDVARHLSLAHFDDIDLVAAAAPEIHMADPSVYLKPAMVHLGHADFNLPRKAKHHNSKQGFAKRKKKGKKTHRK